MAELASMYAHSDDIWKSHEEYLKRYASNYGAMRDFFDEIRHKAERHRSDESVRNRGIAEYVDGWKPE
jgi:hypothetical protein